MVDQGALKARLRAAFGYIGPTQRRDNCAGCTHMARYKDGSVVCRLHSHTRVGRGGRCDDHTPRDPFGGSKR